MASEGHAVERSCRIAGAPHAGYYMWRLRMPSERSIRHAWLLDQVIEVHAASRGTYGTRHVRAELALGRGVRVGPQRRGDVDVKSPAVGIPTLRSAERISPPLSQTATGR